MLRCSPDAEPVVDTTAPIIPGLTEWQNSPYADFESESFRHWDEDDLQEFPLAAPCHSSAGYQDFLGAGRQRGRQGDAPRLRPPWSTAWPATTAPPSPKTSVVFPSGLEITNLGDESRRMECHQGRESKISVDRQITDTFKLDPQDLDTVVAPMVDTAKNVTTTSASVPPTTMPPQPPSTARSLRGYEQDGMSYDGVPASGAVQHGNKRADLHLLEMNFEARDLPRGASRPQRTWPASAWPVP